MSAQHGTRSRYNRGCRCDLCRESHRSYMASLKGREPSNHGTASSYQNYGCRCDPCREAAMERRRVTDRAGYMREWRRRRREQAAS